MSIYLQHEVLRNPKEAKRLAVMGGDQIYILNYADPGAPPWEDVEILGQFSKAIVGDLFTMGVQSVWSIQPMQTIRWVSGEGIKVTPLSIGGKGGTRTAGYTLRQANVDGKEYGNPMCIYDLTVDGWGIGKWTSTWHDGADAVRIGKAVLRASFALNMQLRFSPSYTGLVILREELQRWGDIPAMSEEWIGFLRDKMAHPIAWARSLGDGDPDEEQLTVRHYDRNSSYVSSARMVPVGDPVRHPEMEMKFIQPEDYDFKCPGLFKISTAVPSWREEMPGPFYDGGRYPKDFEGWCWTPQLRFALDHGYTIWIDEAYLWHKHHDYFRSWQKRLWDARNACEGDTIARALIKHIGVAAIGRLRMRSGHAMMSIDEAEAQGGEIEWYERENGELTGQVVVQTGLGRNDLYQPAWWSYIIANAVERVQDALWRATMADKAPVGVWVDSLYLLREFDELNGPQDKVGGWRLADTVQVARAELPDRAQPLNRMLAKLEREG